MVQYSEQIHSFDAPLATVVQAHNIRFPSPYATHVISSDVLSREFEPPSTIKTTRLVLKRGKMPPWAPKAFDRIGTSWVLEVSECDMEREVGKNLRVKSRNIDHKSIMEVVEWQVYQEKQGDKLATTSSTTTRVTSEFGFWPVQTRIEKFGVSRGMKSTEKARAGLNLITSLLLSSKTNDRLLSSGPLKLYPFDPLPGSLAKASELVRTKLEEARRARLATAAGGGVGVDGGPVDGSTEGEEKEMGSGKRTLWRDRLRRASREGVRRFRRTVCQLTGLLCEEKEDHGDEAST
ncbi:MSF1-domain-containing protein [Meredithblackwellia eburnea MCA 4105]